MRMYACTYARVELQLLAELWRGRTVNLEFEHFAIVQRSFSAFGFLKPISAGLGGNGGCMDVNKSVRVSARMVKDGHKSANVFTCTLLHTSSGLQDRTSSYPNTASRMLVRVQLVGCECVCGAY